MFQRETFGEWVTLSDDSYLEWLNDQLDFLYKRTNWQTCPELEKQLEFFENEVAECTYRLGISGRLR